jgi:hypothetical protein
MRRGRVLFWSISGAVIAAGVALLVYLQVASQPTNLPVDPRVEQLKREQFVRDDRPPEPWAPAEAWWKRTTIDAFDRVTQGKRWPSARRAVVAFGSDLSGDPPRTGDAPADAREAASAAVTHGCDDPLVLFIHGRYLLQFETDDVAAQREGPQSLMQAADAMKSATGYAPYLRCLAGFEAARMIASRRPGGPYVPPARAKAFADAAAALLPDAGADPQMPTSAALQLAEAAGSVARAQGTDRMELLDPFVVAMQKSGRPKSHVLTVSGEALTRYAWDARGGGWAETVTPEGWRGFQERLRLARAALTEAWELDNTNSLAAASMITVCMGEGADRQEMERWFKRALDADPGNFNACSRKLTFLEPKWGGSAEDMLAFGRELLRTSTDPRSVRLATVLVDVHWNLAASVGGGDAPEPAYFAEFPEAWEDVRQAYEAYLKQAPGSRYHRTRYAVIAAWAQRWAVADAQFDQLGERCSREVVPEGVIKALREQAKQKAKGPTRRAV